jgi:hypothetical protein
MKSDRIKVQLENHDMLEMVIFACFNDQTANAYENELKTHDRF